MKDHVLHLSCRCADCLAVLRGERGEYLRYLELRERQLTVALERIRDMKPIFGGKAVRIAREALDE